MVCYIPDVIGKTSTARAALPDFISRKDAVYNIGRVAWLINALATSNLENLRFKNLTHCFDNFTMGM